MQWLLILKMHIFCCNLIWPILTIAEITFVVWHTDFEEIRVPNCGKQEGDNANMPENWFDRISLVLIIQFWKNVIERLLVSLLFDSNLDFISLFVSIYWQI